MVAKRRVRTALQPLLLQPVARHGSPARLIHNEEQSDGDIETLLTMACPCAFEIKHGKKVRAGIYAFPVVFFEPPAGNSRISVRLSTITVSWTGDQWAVKKVPQ